MLQERFAVAFLSDALQELGDDDPSCLVRDISCLWTKKRIACKMALVFVFALVASTSALRRLSGICIVVLIGLVYA
jgi:hypothetical protein